MILDYKENMDALNKMSDIKDALFYRELNAKLIRENRELKAENIDLINHQDFEKQGKFKKVIDELKAKLKQCSNVAFVEVLNRSNDKLQAENNELKAELKHKAIKIHQDRIPKEYKAEADEWFEHNPQDEKLFFFMVGGSGVDEDGDVINTLNVGADAIAECDNFEGVISVETYD